MDGPFPSAHTSAKLQGNFQLFSCAILRLYLIKEQEYMSQREAKRQRTESGSGDGGGPAAVTAPKSVSAVKMASHRLPKFERIADAGEDLYRVPEEAEGWVLRHGTSLQLMATCGIMLK